MLTPFTFDQSSTIRVISEDGVPWFVGKEVCAALGYANAADAIEKHCKGVVKRYPLTTPGGVQEVRVLSEGDVLRLILRSRLPAAEQFERWVFDEVLPQIARTGRYVPADTMAALSDPATLRALLLDFSSRTLQLEATVAAQQPKVEAMERLSGAKGALCLRDAAKALQVRQTDLIQWLQRHGWIHKREGTSWKAYHQRIEQGVLTHRVVTRGTGGDERIYDQVLVTPKGVARLAELLAKEPA